jgi:hypothetical protein
MKGGLACTSMPVVPAPGIPPKAMFTVDGSMPPCVQGLPTQANPDIWIMDFWGYLQHNILPNEDVVAGQIVYLTKDLYRRDANMFYSTT